MTLVSPYGPQKQLIESWNLDKKKKKKLKQASSEHGAGPMELGPPACRQIVQDWCLSRA